MQQDSNDRPVAGPQESLLFCREIIDRWSDPSNPRSSERARTVQASLLQQLRSRVKPQAGQSEMEAWVEDLNKPLTGVHGDLVHMEADRALDLVGLSHNTMQRPEIQVHRQMIAHYLNREIASQRLEAEALIESIEAEWNQ